MNTLTKGSLALLALYASAVLAHDPARGHSWQRAADMADARAVHQATLLESGAVLVTGGCAAGCGDKLATAELHDPAGRTFLSLPPMTSARAGHSATRLPDGRVLIAGGWSDTQPVASAEIFDPRTRRFSPAGSMREVRAGHRAVPLADGRVLIVGGERATGASLASAEIYDPRAGGFEPAGAMRTPRAGHAAVRLEDGRVLVTGGHSARDRVERSAEIFDPRTGRFEPAGHMLQARHKHAAVLLDDGRVLVVGGSDARDHEGRLASTEILDPATGAFTAGPSMHAVRHKIVDAVLRLPSGQVLVAGGAERPELYDPARDMFVPVHGATPGERMFVTATLMADGSVLVLGGYDTRTRAAREAWRHVFESRGAGGARPGAL